MNQIFLCSDLHFGHGNVCKFDNRPFSSRGEMNEALIKNWNEAVPARGGKVYILGDMVWGSNNYAKKILRRLNGEKFLVRGNHDRKNIHQLAPEYFAWVKSYYELKLEKNTMVLFHYPIRTWNRKHYGSYHAHGHNHRGPRNPEVRRFNLATNLWDYYPVPLEVLLEEERWLA